MSISNKSNSTQNNLYCEVCKINIQTEAEYALHEFSKKHCDNLLRIAKNKPVATKRKQVKPETPTANKEPPKVNVVTTQGNFAKYGYFIPGEVYDRAAESREFNTEYDPYLQKYAENPLKEITPPAVVTPTEVPPLPTTNVTAFNRKKKKKIRSCQICNVTLLTVPEYEAHMRSPQHSWKLKMSGMGVSAHFVKASSDFHSVQVNEDSSSSEQYDWTEFKTASSGETAGSGTTAALFPTLYCDICELLLNSEQQFNAHVNGKSHNENVVKKAEMKAKKMELESPSPNQLYCFSCKVALNNLYQYNEHKFGKKHKMKCRRLMREGITIPPEERVASWGVPRLDPNKPVVYPEMYEKFILKGQQKTNSYCGGLGFDSESSAPGGCCEPCGVSFSDISTYQTHVNSEEHRQRLSQDNKSPQCDDDKSSLSEIPRVVFHIKKSDGEAPEGRVESPIRQPNEEEPHMEQPNVIGVNYPVRCCLCASDFTEQFAFELHLSAEDHARKVLEMRNKGMSDDEILEMLFRDKTVVKPDKLGRYWCGVCSVPTGNAAEFQQHITSLVHKQSEGDYRRKRMTEIKSAVNPDESGKFTCMSCRESWSGLVEYNQHLHTAKHRESIKAEKTRSVMAKKRALLLQQRRVKQKYIISGLKRKDFACWRKKCEKNPGVRTKITGMAMDLCSGAKASVSNLEPLEPKTDTTRNVTIGASETGTGEKRKAEEVEPLASEEPGKRSRRSDPHPQAIKPLMADLKECPLPLGLRYPRPPNFRGWNPYPPPLYNFRGNSFAGHRVQYPIGRYQRPPSYHPPWPRYPPCYR